MKYVVVIGMLAVSAVACGAESGRTPATTASIATLTALEPSKEAAWPFVFRWEGAGPDHVVRIHVFDDAERRLYGIEARGDHIAAPEGLRKVLEPGERYQWRVAGVDENGEEVGASELVRFVFR